LLSQYGDFQSRLKFNSTIVELGESDFALSLRQSLIFCAIIGRIRI